MKLSTRSKILKFIREVRVASTPQRSKELREQLEQSVERISSLKQQIRRMASLEATYKRAKQSAEEEATLYRKYYEKLVNLIIVIGIVSFTLGAGLAYLVIRNYS
jgi:hypothetical protein